MDKGPLVSEEIDAGARFLAEFQKYRPVQLAFWLQESDTGNWYLYVASDQITPDNFDVAYGEVVEIARTFRDPWLDIFHVKVVNIDDPPAKAVRKLQQHYPGRNRFYMDGQVVGVVSADELYIYPSPITVPTQ